MNQTQYTIYWTLDGYPGSETTYDMTYALKRMEALRKCLYYKAICMACENVDQVGQMGVDSIMDGKTPDGVEYTWVKRRDGGQ